MNTDMRNDGTMEEAYLKLRSIVGYLGMALPFVVFLGAFLIDGTGILSSISSYYHTVMRNVFVGTLWAIAFFMLSYKGYERIDDTTGNWACLFTLGVALFPTTQENQPLDPIGIIHLAFAILMFATLIAFSLFLFTIIGTKPGDPTPKKLLRNKIYRWCGWSMVACMLGIVIFYILSAALSPANPIMVFLVSINPIFWLEAIALFFFGISWFTKGEALKILRDQDPSAIGA